MANAEDDKRAEAINNARARARARADDAPPYMTIFVVGHIIGTCMILVEEYWPDAPIWLHAMVWPTITLILSLWLLPIIKGGLIGHQGALRMHGFETVGRKLIENPWR
jgi:uncharacterized protein (DUF983 family)